MADFNTDSERYSIEAPPVEILDPTRFRNVDIFSPQMKEMPREIFGEWAKFPSFYSVVNGIPSAIVTPYEECERVFSDHENFSSVVPAFRGMEAVDYFNGQLSIGTSDPPAHGRLRRALAPAFSPAKVRQIEDSISNIVRDALDGVREKKIVEIMGDLARPIAHRVILGTVVDLPPDLWPVFLHMSEEMFSLADHPPGTGYPPSYHAAWNEAMGAIDTVISRNEVNGQSVTGSLIAAYKDGELTREEAVAQLLTVYVAGTSPTGMLIGTSLLTFARHPAQWDLLRSDPGLIDKAISEILRYQPPSVFSLRYARRDLHLGDLALLKNMPVYCTSASCFDERLHRDPFRFDITRKINPLLTFGRGIHFCVGSQVARSILKKVLLAAAERYPRLRLAEPEAQIRYTGNPQEILPEAVRIAV